MRVITDPIISPPPAEVPLKGAPLVRVIVQVRFPEVLQIEDREFVAPFQEALREDYPVLRPEQAQSVVFGVGGISSPKPKRAWRFNSVDAGWRVSLASDFLAIETANYTSRSDLLARFRTALVALEEYVEPKVVDRIGVRYIDRITGAAVDDIENLVIPEVRGIVGTPVAVHAKHAISETMLEVPPDAMAVARWGCLSSGLTIDPSAIEPVPEKSWILDLDMFSVGPKPFSVDQVVENSRLFSERIYTIFRWAVTPAFLQRYGGEL